MSWTNVFQRAGNGTNAPADGAVLNLHPITVSLASFAGHSFQIRFNYHCNLGDYFMVSDFDGWYFDSVVFSGLQAVTVPVTAISATTNFNVVPPATGDYLVEACGLVGGAWPLAWSQGKSITVAVVPFVTQVTWAAPAAIVYGTALGASQFNATANVPGRFDYDPPLGTMLGAGAGQTLELTFIPTDTANYATAIRTVSLDVLKALLTVTANDRSKTYGETVTFAGTEFTAAGLQNSESVGTVTLTSSGAVPTATVAGSPYSIVPSAASGGTFNPANYLITYANGTLTINPVTVTVAGITAASKVYDGTTTATINTSGATLNGVLSADKGDVTLMTSGVTGSFADPSVGTNKLVTISGVTLSGIEAGNYALTQPTTTADIVPIPPPTVANPALVGQTFSVLVTAAPGLNYTLEYKNAFTDTAWTAVQTLSCTGGTITLSDGTATNPTRFYRVRVE
jgi:hypothetical protein